MEEGEPVLALHTQEREATSRPSYLQPSRDPGKWGADPPVEGRESHKAHLGARCRVPTRTEGHPRSGTSEAQERCKPSPSRPGVTWETGWERLLVGRAGLCRIDGLCVPLRLLLACHGRSWAAR